KGKADYDYNCYWDERTKTPEFAGLSFADWQKQTERDKHSVVADPLFVNPEARDFRFKRRSVANKIKFKVFDYTQAGVYGSEEWKAAAQLSPNLLKEFDETVARLRGQ
ncbi:MAG: right-handed parallel beta-helix repeat-containing protein, partial [Tannerella sp.]|nr:right-handed parallel beta-helix repeat-containing protein [Tannerella sp.]